MKYLMIIVLTTLSNLLFAQNWKVIYENGAEGRALQGNIDELKEAIRLGEEVRIAWGFQHPQQKDIRVEHLADASFLTIQSDSIVHAQINPIYGQSPDFDQGIILLKENLEWVFIGGTNGKMDSMTRNTITGEIVNHSMRNSRFKWYVRN